MYLVFLLGATVPVLGSHLEDGDVHEEPYESTVKPGH